MFQRDVRNLMEPFYLICGYGETGGELVRALDKNELRVVVLEISPERINELEMTDYQFYIPHLCADAKLSEVLLYAGIKNPMCRGVAALTDDDHANLAISVAVKLIKPDLPVLARVQNDVIAANMASFGTDRIINPYNIFGEHLAMRLNAGHLFVARMADPRTGRCDCHTSARSARALDCLWFRSLWQVSCEQPAKWRDACHHY